MPEENVRADKLGGTARRRNESVREVRAGAQGAYKYISADNHIDLVWYPRDIIQSRIAGKFKDAAPKVVESDKGTAWQWEGDIHAFAADGKDWAKYAKRFDPVEVEEGRLPPSDPEVLLQHMDLGELYAGVFYGNTRKWTFKDKELEKAVYQAFNDWALEACAHAPDRLFVLPWLHAAFPETCADELRRLADRGVRAVELSPNDMAEGVWSPVWEPVWDAAEETGTVICTHIGDAAGTPYPPNEARAIAGALLASAVQSGGQAHRPIRVQRDIRPPPQPARFGRGVPDWMAALPLPVDAAVPQRPDAGLHPSAAGGAPALPEAQYVVHLRGGLHRREDDSRPGVPDSGQRDLGLRLPARAGADVAGRDPGDGAHVHWNRPRLGA